MKKGDYIKHQYRNVIILPKDNHIVNYSSNSTTLSRIIREPSIFFHSFVSASELLKEEQKAEWKPCAAKGSRSTD